MKHIFQQFLLRVTLRNCRTDRVENTASQFIGVS
jgi:hypothetical protein